MMTFSQRRYGTEHFLIDSLMRVEGLEEEYVEQGRFLNRLQEFAKNTGAHIHLVAHPRKMNEDGKPSKMDVKGSSLIPNNADNIVAVCRNFEKMKKRKDNTLTPEEERNMHDTEIRVEKQRDSGWEGRFLLRFNPYTFSFSAHLAEGAGK
jgi:twinkle protein